MLASSFGPLLPNSGRISHRCLVCVLKKEVIYFLNKGGIGL